MGHSSSSLLWGLAGRELPHATLPQSGAGTCSSVPASPRAGSTQGAWHGQSCLAPVWSRLTPPRSARPEGRGGGQEAARSLRGDQSCFVPCRKNMQRNKQVAMGRKKFNMDPKKVRWGGLGRERGSSAACRGPCWALPPRGPGARLPAGAGEAVGRLAGSAASPRAAPPAPVQGIQFLIENDLLKNTCEDIAQFLYKGEGLNKTAIGDYLGERYGAGPGWLGSPEGALGSRCLRDGTQPLFELTGQPSGGTRGAGDPGH